MAQNPEEMLFIGKLTSTSSAKKDDTQNDSKSAISDASISFEKIAQAFVQLAEAQKELKGTQQENKTLSEQINTLKESEQANKKIITELTQQLADLKIERDKFKQQEERVLQTNKTAMNQWLMHLERAHAKTEQARTNLRHHLGQLRFS